MTSATTADPALLAARLLGMAAGQRRVIVGVCGAPGAGKSTLTSQVADEINAVRRGAAVVVGMDGFHLAASVIAGDQRAQRRGAPDTFDPAGYAALLRRLREQTDEIVYAPEFRREIEDPVGSAVAVSRECPIVLTEGNYLLHPGREWRKVRDCLDEVWFLEAPSEAERVAALINRHVRFGKTPEHASDHVLRSDEANAELVASHSAAADLILRWPSWAPNAR